MRTGGSHIKSERPFSFSDKILFSFGAVLSAIAATKAGFSLSDPWDTTIPEVSVVHSVLNLLDPNRRLYQDFSVFPFTTTPYGPIFYAVVAMGGFALGGSANAVYFAGRIISLLSFLTCLWFVYSISMEMGASSRSSLITVLWLGGVPNFFPWMASVRPDFMATAFSLAGLYLAVRSPDAVWRVPLTASWLVTMFIKPNFVSGPAAVAALFLLRGQRRSFFKWSGSFFIAATVLGGAAVFVFGFAFISNIVSANMTRFSWFGAKSMFVEKLFPLSFLILSLAIAGFAAAFPRRKEGLSLAVLFSTISILVFGYSSLKVGADENYFVEPILSLGLFIPLALDHLANSDWRSWLNRAVLTFAVILIAMTLPWRRSFADLTHALARPGRSEFHSRVKGLNGTALFVSNGLGLRMNRGETFHDSYNASTLEHIGAINLDTLRARVEKRAYSAVVKLMHGTYFGVPVFPKSLQLPLEVNYRLETVAPPLEWWALRSVPLRPHRSAYPVVHSPETQVFLASKHTYLKGLMSQTNDDGVLLRTNGFLGSKFKIPKSGLYQIDVFAKASEYPGVKAWAKISIGRFYSKTYEVEPVLPGRYSDRVRLPAGWHEVRIGFLNDRYDAPCSDDILCDLNLFVERVEFTLMHPNSLRKP